MVASGIVLSEMNTIYIGHCALELIQDVIDNGQNCDAVLVTAFKKRQQMTAFEVDLRLFSWPWLCATKYPAFQTNQFGFLDIFLGGISWPNLKPKAPNKYLNSLTHPVAPHLG